MDNEQKLPLHRKYRLANFEDFVGNESIIKALNNTLKRRFDRRLPQALIFEGQFGSGKTTLARILSREYNCENPDKTTGRSCGVCYTCKAINQFILTGEHTTEVYEVDATDDRSAKDMDNLLMEAYHAPFNTKYKIYIIDEFQCASEGAQQRLLKILEEPPEHLIFIFCTTNKERIKDTIKSRCITYTVVKPTLKGFIKRLKTICELEDIPHDKDGLTLIVRKADCIPRNSLIFLERVFNETGSAHKENVEESLRIVDENELANIMTYIKSKDIYAYVNWVYSIVNPDLYLEQFVIFLKNGLYVSNNISENFTKEEVKMYATTFKHMTIVDFVKWFELVSDVINKNLPSDAKLLLLGLKQMGLEDSLADSLDSAEILKDTSNANQNFVDKNRKKPADIEALTRTATLEDIDRLFATREVYEDLSEN